MGTGAGPDGVDAGELIRQLLAGKGDLYGCAPELLLEISKVPPAESRYVAERVGGARAAPSRRRRFDAGYQRGLRLSTDEALARAERLIEGCAGLAEAHTIAHNSVASAPARRA